MPGGTQARRGGGWRQTNAPTVQAAVSTQRERPVAGNPATGAPSVGYEPGPAVDPENAYRAFQRRSRPQRSCSQPLVVVMQSTHFRESDHRALLRRLHRSGVRAIHAQREMRPPAMVILEVARKQAPQMALTHHNDLIQTLSG
jgi:hypothetical protein